MPFHAAAHMRKLGRSGRAMGGAALLFAGVLATSVFPGSASADADGPANGPVVLELYTAQGCASCPPADDMMLELAARDDVIALALHVDYWDYIGWVDTFASPDYTQRQQRYARRHGHSTIYTPQVVVNGIEIVEGYRVMQVMDVLEAHRARPLEIEMTLNAVDGGGLEIFARAIDMPGPAMAMASRRSALPGTANALVGSLNMGEAADPAAEPVPMAVAREQMSQRPSYELILARYSPIETVEILGGENAGRTARYANVVTEFRAIGTWDLQGSLEMTVPMSGDAPVVVLLQEVGQGEIIAAARLR